jgi:OOP family OmpA-OmpF porin
VVAPVASPAPPPAAAKPATAARLWFNNEAGTATLSGSLPDAATRAAVVDALRGSFGADKTRADLVIDPNAAPAPWLAQLPALFDKFHRPGVSALFDGDSISLGGLGSEAERNALIASLKGIVGEGIRFGNLADQLDALVAGANRQAGAALAALGAGFSARDLTEALNHAIIRFASGSAALPEGATPLLDAAAERLRALPAGTVIEIGGYTDSTGETAANLVLSEQRAEAVQRHLLGAGVSAATLRTKGYGSADPVAANDTAIGRFRNRRIAYRVVAP